MSQKNQDRGSTQRRRSLTNRRRRRRGYQVLFFKEPEGGYSVEVPELPGCFTQGETLAEARAKAKEAIQGYLEAVHLIDSQKPSGGGVFTPVNVRVEKVEV